MAEHKMEYPSNSELKKNPGPSKEEPQEEKVVVKVVSGVVRRQKRGPLSKLRETFMGSDARSVGSFLLQEVVIPATKNMISDAGSQGLERLLFGEARSNRRRSSNNHRESYSNYHRAYRSERDPRDRDRDAPRHLSSKARANHDFDDILLDSRGEAEEVLDSLGDLLARFGSVTVADLYELVGTTSDFPDNKWGWEELRTARVRQVRHGYLIDLPRPHVLD